MCSIQRRAAEVEGLVGRPEVYCCFAAATAIDGVHIPNYQVDAALQTLCVLGGVWVGGEGEERVARRCVLEEKADLMLKSLQLQLLRRLYDVLLS